MTFLQVFSKNITNVYLLNEDNSVHGYFSKFEKYPNIVSTNEILTIAISPIMNSYELNYNNPLYVDVINLNIINYIQIYDTNNPSNVEVFTRIIPNDFFFQINTLSLIKRYVIPYLVPHIIYQTNNDSFNEKINNFNIICDKYNNSCDKYNNICNKKNNMVSKKKYNKSIIPSGVLVKEPK